MTSETRKNEKKIKCRKVCLKMQKGEEKKGKNENEWLIRRIA